MLLSYGNGASGASAAGGASSGASAAGGASSGAGSMMGGAAAVISIIQSLWSIYSSISNWSKSKKAYDAVIEAARTHKGVAVPTSDPTGGSATPKTDTNYKPLAGYLTKDKYKEIVNKTSAPIATEAMASLTDAPAKYVKDPNKDARGKMTGGTVTGTQQITSATAGQQANAQQPPGVRIVNVVDQSLVHDFMASSAGEKVILNTLQKNAASIKEYVR